MTRKIPVYVAYFTAWPDKNGTVEYFDDIYDRDARLKLAMEKTAAVARPEQLITPKPRFVACAAGSALILRPIVSTR